MGTRIDRGSIALLLVGALLVGGAILVSPQIAGVTHTTEVRDVAATEAKNSDRLYHFQNLSERGRVVFREAKNTVGGTTFEGVSKRPPEFDYYDDTAWRGYVEQDGEYYGVYGTREDCLGLSCLVPSPKIGVMALVGVLAFGAGLKRGLRR